eukprot:5985978-Pyramimonas_sp.AAC.1
MPSCWFFRTGAGPRWSRVIEAHSTLTHDSRRDIGASHRLPGALPRQRTRRTELRGHAMLS